MKKHQMRYTILPDFAGAWGWANDGGALVGGACHAMGSDWCAEHEIPQELAERFGQWQYRFESARKLPDPCWCLDLDWQWFHEVGLSLTRCLKMHLGNSARVFYLKPIEDRRSSRDRCCEILANGMTRKVPMQHAQFRGGTNSFRRLERIVSGGQAGVDRAALDWSLYSGFLHGGWCPKGRRAEDGTIPVRYLLEETASPGYLDRTRRNVLDSDATLILNRGALEGGTLKTLTFAQNSGKPVLVVQLDSVTLETERTHVLDWIASDSILVLNIAGPRESKCPGIYKQARRFLKSLYPHKARPIPGEVE